MRNIYLLLFATALSYGCSRMSSIVEVPQGDTPIVISSANSTRGEVVEDENFLTMELFAYYTGAVSWSEATEDDIELFMDSQLVEREDNYSPWSYSPVKYWPSDEMQKISFFALSPHETISCHYDEISAKPIFTHSLTTDAKDNADILWCTPLLDKNGESGTLTFDFSHALTRLSLSCKVNNASSSHSYSISAVTFENIVCSGEISYSTDSYSPSWVASGEAIDITASQSTTLLDHDTQAALLNETSYSDIILDGSAIFMMPQAIESSTADSKPSVRLTICDISDTGEELYDTPSVALTTVSGTGWNSSEWTELRFSFDVKNNEVTLDATIQHYWEELYEDITIPDNFYIYADQNEIELAANSELSIYTNFSGEISFSLEGFTSDIQLTSTSREVTSSGDIVHRVAVDCSSATGGEMGQLIATIPASNGATITKVFSLTIN